MTVQNPYLNNAIDTTMTRAPARIAAKHTTIEQVMVVLNGHKKAERILSYALEFASERQAELVVIHTYEPSLSDAHAEQYLKGLKNKLQAQYANVNAFLYDGKSAVSALQAVIDERKQTCVLTLNEKSSWFRRFWQEDIAAIVDPYRENLIVHQVEL